MGMKNDLGRYLWMHRHGGVYADIDTFPLRSLDSLLDISPHSPSHSPSHHPVNGATTAEGSQSAENTAEAGRVSDTSSSSSSSSSSQQQLAPELVVGLEADFKAPELQLDWLYARQRSASLHWCVKLTFAFYRGAVPCTFAYYYCGL